MITIAETEPYRRKAAKLLSEEERNDLIAYLSEHPTSGVIIQGTHGIRKLRWARSGGGKRGGYRVIYYFHSEVMPLYLLTVFGKNERANLSDKEKQLLTKIVQRIVEYWRTRNG
jgi:mRNA-degrading endonuclease RelE of RelBE toxin-antitoxin system